MCTNNEIMAKFQLGMLDKTWCYFVYVHFNIKFKLWYWKPNLEIEEASLESEIDCTFIEQRIFLLNFFRNVVLKTGRKLKIAFQRWGGQSDEG